MACAATLARQVHRNHSRRISPSLRLIAPSGSKLRAPTTFLLEAEAPGSSVQSLGFLAGTNLLGVVTHAPYQFQWTVSEAGEPAVGCRKRRICPSFSTGSSNRRTK
jgi:hypothetical protein